MPLTEIRKDIEKEAEKEASRIRSEANAEKDKILKEASEKASQIKEEYEKGTKDELNRLEQEYSASVDLALKKVYLDAREEALDSEIKGFKDELAESMRENESVYRSIFSNAVKEASTMAPIRELTAIISKPDAKFVEKNGPRIEYQEVDGGLIVMSQDKSVRIDARLKNIIDSRSEEIRSALLETMFPEKQSSSRKRTTVKITKSTVKKHSKKSHTSKPKTKKTHKKK